MKTIKKIIFCAFLFLSSYSVYAIDWIKVETKQVTLFYPGQSSWEWILTKADHGGAKNFRKGKSCTECHQGEEKDIGNLLVVENKLEPHPINGKRGFVDVAIKTAHDDKKFYIQLTWKESTESVSKRLSQDQTRVTVLFDDGSVSSVKRGGCWATCHDDATGMPSAEAGKERNLYLAKSRTKLSRKGGGENVKSSEELKKLLAEGIFVEYWQAKLNKDKAAASVDAHILKARHENKKTKITVNAEIKGGVWVVEMSRLLTPNLPHTKNIVAGKEYNFGVAIHDAFSEGRHHLVSFGHSFVLDKGKADFISIKQ